MLNERTSKYPDDNAKRMAIRLLKILSPEMLKKKDYFFSATDPSELVFRFYLPLLKQESNVNNHIQTLPRLLQFTEQYRASMKIFVDYNRLCIEIRAKR